MSRETDSVIVVLHLKGDRIENLSSIDADGSGTSRETLDKKIVDAVQASISSGVRQANKMQFVRNLLSIAGALALVAMIPLAVAATLLVREATTVAASVRRIAFEVSVSRESFVKGINTLAHHAEELSPERDRQLLNDVNVIVHRLQPYADAVRPLFVPPTK